MQSHPAPLAVQLDAVFAAISDETRRSILARLQPGPLTVTALAAPYSMSLNAVSKHIKKLEKAGLIRRDIRGRERYCALEPVALRPALEWMEHYQSFWSKRLDKLAEHLTVKRKGRKQ